MSTLSTTTLERNPEDNGDSEQAGQENGTKTLTSGALVFHALTLDSIIAKHASLACLHTRICTTEQAKEEKQVRAERVKKRTSSTYIKPY